MVQSGRRSAAPPPPVLHPGTLQAISPDDLAPLFPMTLIQQEVATERDIEIPQPVRDIYRNGGPARCTVPAGWKRRSALPARIYYKYEGVSPAGSHKPNTAVAQAFYNKEAGITRIATETGAGQWGSSLAFAGALFGIDVQVFMVRISYNQKPYRRALMETHGARCAASPSEETTSGRAISPSGPIIRAVSASPSPRQWKSPRNATTPNTFWVRCSAMCCCIKP